MEKIAEERTPQDVLAGILLFMPGSCLNANTKVLHEGLASLRGSFPNLLEDFMFTENEPYPYSDELEEALGYLSVARIIGKENPDYQVMTIKERTRPYLELLVDRGKLSVNPVCAQVQG